MFKKPSTAVNALTAVAAVFLSILLVVTLPLVSVYGVAIDSISADSIGAITRTTINELVEGADFEQMILENEAVQENIRQMGIPSDVVGNLMQSGAANEIVDLLAADMSNLLTDPAAETQMTPEALVAIVEKHADDLAQIAVDTSEKRLDKEILKTEIINAVKADADGFAAVLPDMTEMRASVATNLPLDLISGLLNSLYLWIGCGVCLLLAGLVYLCRFFRFGGLLWLGIDGLLGAGLLSLAGQALRIAGNMALVSLPDSAKGILGTIIGRTLHAVNLRVWILLGIAVVLVAAYILLYYLVVKKKATPAAPQPVVAVQN